MKINIDKEVFDYYTKKMSVPELQTLAGKLLKENVKKEEKPERVYKEKKEENE